MDNNANYEIDSCFKARKDINSFLEHKFTKILSSFLEHIHETHAEQYFFHFKGISALIFFQMLYKTIIF